MLGRKMGSRRIKRAFDRAELLQRREEGSHQGMPKRFTPAQSARIFGIVGAKPLADRATLERNRKTAHRQIIENAIQQGVPGREILRRAEAFGINVHEFNEITTDIQRQQAARQKGIKPELVRELMSRGKKIPRELVDNLRRIQVPQNLRPEQISRLESMSDNEMAIRLRQMGVEHPERMTRDEALRYFKTLGTRKIEKTINGK